MTLATVGSSWDKHTIVHEELVVSIPTTASTTSLLPIDIDYRLQEKDDICITICYAMTVKIISSRIVFALTLILPEPVMVRSSPSFSELRVLKIHQRILQVWFHSGKLSDSLER
jgi:hypothetical protein